MENEENVWQSSKELVDHGFEYIQHWMKKDSALLGLDTGFADLNNILSGLQPGNLLMLGGRPAMGKTALMQNIALNIAKAGHGVAIFSFADSAEQCMLRMIGIESLVSVCAIRNGHISEDTDLPKIIDACETIYSLPIFIQDRAASVEDIIARVRYLYENEKNIDLVVVDYIGLIEATNYMLNRSEAIAETSRKLKSLAKELNLCILVLSQLKRSLEQRSDKRPILSDLRGTGALEQDADVICFIYRDEYYYPDTPAKGRAEIIIAKQRNGPTGTVILNFEGKQLRFYEHTDSEYFL